MQQEAKHAINIIDNLIETLTSKAASYVKEVQDLLKTQKPQKYNPDNPEEKRAKPIWVRLRKKDGYDTFSIAWSRFNYYHHETRRSYFKDIPRGRSYCIPWKRFMQIVRGYHPEIQKELWEYEKIFGEIRQYLAFLSQSRVPMVNFHKKAAKPIGESE